ncbi:lactoylglutathione lyase [Calidithermus terrae]|uniref:Lactoylglutathione lyase n=1 Tax=Calidithermus terrae TaxID=1408545 RepID=A0A399EWY8_9DEIN|nr:VOC family protein [Calidithermus terrae]RIH87956.1 lactoylglutathione lyase [Calidithermus terrae]
MGVQLNTPGLHHVVLRVGDLERAKHFYTQVLGFSNVILDVPGALFLFTIGNSTLGVRGPDANTPAGDRFDPFRVGLDHVAIACPSVEELHRAAAALREAGVEVIGPKTDEFLGMRFPYIAFRDPDGIKWEYYAQEA